MIHHINERRCKAYPMYGEDARRNLAVVTSTWGQAETGIVHCQKLTSKDNSPVSYWNIPDALVASIRSPHDYVEQLKDVFARYESFLWFYSWKWIWFCLVGLVLSITCLYLPKTRIVLGIPHAFRVWWVGPAWCEVHLCVVWLWAISPNQWKLVGSSAAVADKVKLLTNHTASLVEGHSGLMEQRRATIWILEWFTAGIC